MSLTSDRRIWPKLAFGLFALLGACTKTESDAQPASSAAVPRARPAPRGSTAASVAGPFGCHMLRPKAEWEPQGRETIRLRPPDPAEKAIVLNKTGVIARFSRNDFLIAARCLNLKQAVANLESETGHTNESPLRDAFGLSYVAAALLDIGRVGVRLRTETEFRPTLVREAWVRDGCSGACRGFGRAYRLAEPDPFPFFNVSDRLTHKAKPKTE